MKNVIEFSTFDSIIDNNRNNSDVIFERNSFLNLSTNTTGNVLMQVEYPRFDSRALVVVIVYCCVFVVACIGNVTVFVNLFRSRRRKSRISFLIIHLTVADLIVTFIMIPFEIAWRITVQWLGGNIACKILLFFRAFGLYLSSNVLICISLDRYFAVVHPLMMTNKRSRGKWMLYCAWLASTFYASPQILIFHVETHPHFANFTQCVSFDSFASPRHEFLYNILCLTMMYFLPLTIIVAAYASILWKMWRKARDSKRDEVAARGCNSSSTKLTHSLESKGAIIIIITLLIFYTVSNMNETTFSQERSQVRKHRDHVILRRSDMKCIERARIRTLKMTAVIVIIFLVCWTPYAVITLWYMFDRESAQRVPMWLQDGLFMMAVSNSCMNPFVYGRYSVQTAAGTRTTRWCLFGCFPYVHKKHARNVSIIEPRIINKRRHYVTGGGGILPMTNFMPIVDEKHLIRNSSQGLKLRVGGDNQSINEVAMVEDGEGGGGEMRDYKRNSVSVSSWQRACFHSAVSQPRADFHAEHEHDHNWHSGRSDAKSESGKSSKSVRIDEKFIYHR